MTSSRIKVYPLKTSQSVRRQARLSVFSLVQSNLAHILRMMIVKDAGKRYNAKHFLLQLSLLPLHLTALAPA